MSKMQVQNNIYERKIINPETGNTNNFINKFPVAYSNVVNGTPNIAQGNIVKLSTNANNITIPGQSQVAAYLSPIQNQAQVYGDIQSLANANFTKPGQLENKRHNISDNFINNIVNEEDIYLETSQHNPFFHSTTSKNFANDNFKNFINQKKFEVKNKEIYRKDEFLFTSKNQLVYIKILEAEKVKNSNDLSTNNMETQVIIKMTKNSIVAFNINTNFSLYSGDYFPICYLNFDSVSTEVILNPVNLTIKICVLGSEKFFVFIFANKTFYELFAFTLSSVVSQSLGYNTNLYSLCLRKDFYKVKKKIFSVNK